MTSAENIDAARRRARLHLLERRGLLVTSTTDVTLQHDRLRTVIARTHGRVLRLSVLSNSYVFQSHVSVEVLDEASGTWQKPPLVWINGEATAVGLARPGGRYADWSVFDDDVVEGFLQAMEIYDTLDAATRH